MLSRRLSAIKGIITSVWRYSTTTRSPVTPSGMSCYHYYINCNKKGKHCSSNKIHDRLLFEYFPTKGIIHFMTKEECTNQNNQLAYLLGICLMVLYGLTKDITAVFLLLFCNGAHRLTIFYYFIKRLWGSFQFEVRHVSKWQNWEEKGKFRFAWFLSYAAILCLLFFLFSLNYYYALLALIILGFIFYQKKNSAKHS